MKLVIDIPYGLRDTFERENWTALDCMEMKKALQNSKELGSQWIPVNDRLPEEFGRYLVTYQSFLKGYNVDLLWFWGEAGLAERENAFFKTDSEGMVTIFGNVTAWMPLPEPYKEDESDGEYDI